MIQHFEPDRLYRPDDPALAVVGQEITLRRWRSVGCGPRYFKGPKLVFYKGADLNDWLARTLVEIDPAAGKDGAK